MSNIKRGFGWVPDKFDARDHQYMASPQVIGNLPPKVDLRPQMPAVYDQGSVGSCTAQSACAAFSFCQKKEKIFSFEPSRLFTYYATRDIEGTTDQDAGAMIRDAIKSINKFGVCPDSIWPYDVDKLTVKPTETCYSTASRHIAVSYTQVLQNINHLKACLAAGYPFVLGMTVYENFETEVVANTGKLQMPSDYDQEIGSHAVLGVGYDESQKIFIIRNSWGPQWGMAGYFTLPYEYILAPSLTSDFWTIKIVR